MWHSRYIEEKLVTVLLIENWKRDHKSSIKYKVEMKWQEENRVTLLSFLEILSTDDIVFVSDSSSCNEEGM